MRFREFRKDTLPPIYWAAFTWEAFATLATGFVAVAAAYNVGRRQVAIAEQQKDILARQVALDELKLRSDLFDRRFSVYEATRTFLTEVMRTADKVTAETQYQFTIAIDQSIFLFREEVRASLLKIWSDYCHFEAIKSTMNARFASSGEYGQDNIDSEYKYLATLDTTLRSLSQLFGDELRLGA